jgi:transcriptional regulator with XRE-family HTH domain
MGIFHYRISNLKFPSRGIFLLPRTEERYAGTGGWMANQLDIVSLGERLKKIRIQREKTLKDVLEDTGISIATLSRIERGEAKEIESETLLSLVRWMDVSLEIFNKSFKSPSTKKSTPDVVELHLRADKNLNPETATILAKMFRATYEQLASGKNKA